MAEKITDLRLYYRSRSLLDKVTGCWIWQLSRNVKGYGYGLGRSAHRGSYQAYIGPIPHNLTIDHLCRTTSCVNPSHMEVVTNKENIMRGTGIAPTNAKKTHCIRGHSLSDENLLIQKGRFRTCRICSCESKTKYNRKKRGEPKAQRKKRTVEGLISRYATP